MRKRSVALIRQQKLRLTRFGFGSEAGKTLFVTGGFLTRAPVLHLHEGLPGYSDKKEKDGCRKHDSATHKNRVHTDTNKSYTRLPKPLFSQKEGEIAAQSWQKCGRNRIELWC
jgi:hypothetical protein